MCHSPRRTFFIRPPEPCGSKFVLIRCSWPTKSFDSAAQKYHRKMTGREMLRLIRTSTEPPTPDAFTELSNVPSFAAGLRARACSIFLLMSFLNFFCSF